MRRGEGNDKEAKVILSNSFLMLCVVSAVLTVLFLLFKNRLLVLFGASSETFPYANTYMTIYTLGTFFALMAIGLNYFITCQGFAAVGMFTVLIGAVSNIILDPVFIFVFRMGVAGAAIATVLSQLFSCLFALCFLFGKSVPIRISFGSYRPALMKRIVSLGFSPFMILATDSVITIILNASLQHYGGPEQGDLLIAASTIIQSWLLMITSTMLGISSGTQAILSYNYGAANSLRIKKAERTILSLCLIFTSIMFVLSRIFPAPFAGIFTREPDTVSHGRPRNSYRNAGHYPAEPPVLLRGRLHRHRTDQKLPWRFPCCEKELMSFPFCFFRCFSEPPMPFTRSPSAMDWARLSRPSPFFWYSRSIWTGGQLPPISWFHDSCPFV